MELCTLTGDADLFMSTETNKPTVTNNIWQSDSNGDDIIVISPDDGDFIAGCYYIGVSGTAPDLEDGTTVDNGFSIIVSTRMVRRHIYLCNIYMISSYLATSLSFSMIHT